MAAAPKGPRQPRLAWWGYALMNGVVIVLCLAVYLLAKKGMVAPDAGAFARPGLASAMLFIPLAFLAASLYDAIYDRVAAAKPLGPADGESEEAAPK